jgi:hypothetical protein
MGKGTAHYQDHDTYRQPLSNHICLSIVSTFARSMRSSTSSSTPPLSHRANKPSFPQSNLTPVSPPTSINGEDSLPQPGFGWEFEYALEDRMRQKQHEVNARFQRYERFGMRWEEARLPTPDHLRKAYDELVEAIENDRTPSLSPESAVADTRNLRRVNATQRQLGPKATTKKGLHHAIRKGLRYLADDFSTAQNSFRHSDQNRISKQTQAKAMWPRRRKQVNHWKESIHGMTTRSKVAALRRI